MENTIFSNPVEIPNSAKVLESNLAMQSLVQKKQCAANIIQNLKGEILLLKRSINDSFCPGVYCLPGGGINSMENPKVAAIRETMEECALYLPSVSLVKIVELPEVDIHYFKSMVTTTQQTSTIRLDEKEHGKYEWCGPDKWLAMDLILDLKSHLKNILNVSEVVEDTTSFDKGEDNDELEKGGAGSGRKKVYEDELHEHFSGSDLEHAKSVIGTNTGRIIRHNDGSRVAVSHLPNKNYPHGKKGIKMEKVDERGMRISKSEDENDIEKAKKYTRKYIKNGKYVYIYDNSHNHNKALGHTEPIEDDIDFHHDEIRDLKNQRNQHLADMDSEAGQYAQEHGDNWNEQWEADGKHNHYGEALNHIDAQISENKRIIASLREKADKILAEHPEELHEEGEDVPAPLLRAHAANEERKLSKGEVDNDLEKAEGSRGGKIIGHTKTGRAIYFDAKHPLHKEYTSKDHFDAATAHAEFSLKKDLQSKDKDHHHSQEMLHRSKVYEMAGHGKADEYLKEWGRDKEGHRIDGDKGVVAAKEAVKGKTEKKTTPAEKPTLKEQEKPKEGKVESKKEVDKKPETEEKKKENGGKTSSGKAISYQHGATHESHKDFTSKDHQEAAEHLKKKHGEHMSNAMAYKFDSPEYDSNEQEGSRLQKLALTHIVAAKNKPSKKNGGTEKKIDIKKGEDTSVEEAFDLLIK